jgi:hypothetical protein
MKGCDATRQHCKVGGALREVSDEIPEPVVTEKGKISVWNRTPVVHFRSQ